MKISKDKDFITRKPPRVSIHRQSVIMNAMLHSVAVPTNANVKGIRPESAAAVSPACYTLNIDIYAQVAQPVLRNCHDCRNLHRQLSKDV
ncbi:hypothetical protein CDAR_434911 [Caerostris darwini]|uniref:Uncharacterized protein n=1 Tax=Caerostris darwini TaxID=1538125 RepID=A0AAV4QE41_9ARAC|nr:hypothetical protein CDAR_434911 [Caerostris darwini]